MVTAFVLVKVKPGSDEKLWEDISKLGKVKEIAWVYGEYDLILKVESFSLDQLDDFIFALRKIENIKDTKTLIMSKIKSL